ncbi:hypothetical protein [Kribbella sp. NPDC051718]|uniref:hypothetical protein n=1 Tax=Kribbella sp. NPDC051718 TaxID=3155168 RepID=UPI00344A3512
MATRYHVGCDACPFVGSYASEAKADYAFSRHSCERWLRRAADAERYRARNAAIDRTPKPCLHKQANHEHGTYACYVQDLCRCLPCAASNASYEENRTRQQAYGRWNGLVDAGPARAHIQSLLNQGMGLKRIIAVTDLSSGMLWKLMYGKRRPDGRQVPAKRITPRNEERILAIQLNVADGARVDNTGTVRRIQALVALGWSQSNIARRLGISRANFTPIAQGLRPATTGAHDRAVRGLYAELSMKKPPETTHREKLVASRSRNYAKAHGWVSPLAWDDESIDDPAAKPYADTETDTSYVDQAAVERRMSGDKSVRLNAAEQAELVRRMTAAGTSRNEVERRTGINPQRALRQAS